MFYNVYRKIVVCPIHTHILSAINFITDVSGGPFGIEPSIRAGGNFYAILGFIVFPLIWSVPEALVTAELGAAFQDPSAGVAWVEEAFGESMACMCGYLAWVSGATGMYFFCFGLCEQTILSDCEK